MEPEGYKWIAEMKADQGSSQLVTGQQELLPLSLTGKRPGFPPGQHIEFVGDVGGAVYYCKGDRRGVLVCATEWFYSSVARHLGIAVPDFAVIHDPDNDELLFGSRETWGTADRFVVETLLTTPPSQDRAVGDPYPWLGAYLSRVYTYDLFAGNADRQLSSYLLVPSGRSRTLLAYDFASARLVHGSATQFDIAHSSTMFVGKQLRKLRAFEPSSAMELLDRINAVPVTEIEAILGSLPSEWLSEDQRGKIHDQWSNGVVGDRVDALRSGLKDGTLL